MPKWDQRLKPSDPVVKIGYKEPDRYAYTIAGVILAHGFCYVLVPDDFSFNWSDVEKKLSNINVFVVDNTTEGGMRKYEVRYRGRTG